MGCSERTQETNDPAKVKKASCVYSPQGVKCFADGRNSFLFTGIFRCCDMEVGVGKVDV
jgi:hypothetical protein